jgi:hypothetical protein
MLSALCFFAGILSLRVLEEEKKRDGMERHLSCSEWVGVLSGPAGTGVDAAIAHLAGCGPCWDGVAGAVEVNLLK